MGVIEESDMVGEKLVEIMKKYKKNVWLKFFKTDLKGVWVVIVNASQDYVNVKLGEEYGFPRGFPILWKKDLGIVEYKGFYPKFSNDDVGQKTMESDMFKGAKTMSIEKKVSGFLGIVIATEFEGEVYWLPVTKRSAMGEMVDNFAEIITPYMTRELVEAMVERGVHIVGR